MYPFINLGILEIQIYQGSQYNLMKVAKILNKINGMNFSLYENNTGWVVTPETFSSI